MVNLVIVSHSLTLAQGIAELAGQMLAGKSCRLAIAAGIDDPSNPFGTDPLQIMAAIGSVADADHVLVLMDMGSAILSAETALELLEPAIAAKVRLCAAPLVEGTMAACVSASAGNAIEVVIAEAMNALAPKQLHLKLSDNVRPLPAPSFAAEQAALSVSVRITNRHGLHVRPAAKLVAALAGFNSQLMLEKNGHCVTPDSINHIALLQVRFQDKLRLLAKGPDAEAALAAFAALAAENFGEPIAERAPQALVEQTQVQGDVLLYPRPALHPICQQSPDVLQEQSRLKRAIDLTLKDLNVLMALADEKYSADIAAIFSSHHALVGDADLFAAACEVIRTKQYCAEQAWYQVLKALSNQYCQLSDPYLQARFIDVEDILQRSLNHLQGRPQPLPNIMAPVILVADDIFPSTVLQLDAQRVKGICLQESSVNSHSAIIARQAGIAFLCQQAQVLNLRSGETLTLDISGQRTLRL
ncbi:dihydroxyacetone kinase phosphoryl donor subunit DhaM [Enterobacter sp. CC120223-11]|uniref:dihydroxyacetone kinase phosphoryl donor subunit DhaM n=1 Tax=Enterobacter sp. CC120223-11 TaxID=1378073 RepID=UPI000BCC29D7|nr:dihydroxyacetone kinase phosphoryl donor subunit DhaM [Enterobacter sp. CC120223-11]SNY58857.1 PTS hybrid protein [Enterobacter sp. CC120223-11]